MIWYKIKVKYQEVKTSEAAIYHIPAIRSRVEYNIQQEEYSGTMK